MQKNAFIDDRTFDAEEKEDIISAVEEVAKMDNEMGQETNISKSKFSSTKEVARKIMEKTKIAELEIKVVKGFKLLGGRCTVENKIDYNDPEEAAEEAKLRVKRIKQMPLPRKDKAKLIKTSPMKVLVANMQWAKPKPATLTTLGTNILDTIWGETRKMRCGEIVDCVLNDAEQLEPSLAIIWQVLTSARRMMIKSKDVKETTIDVLQSMLNEEADGTRDAKRKPLDQPSFC